MLSKSAVKAIEEAGNFVLGKSLPGSYHNAVIATIGSCRHHTVGINERLPWVGWLCKRSCDVTFMNSRVMVEFEF